MSLYFLGIKSNLRADRRIDDRSEVPNLCCKRTGSLGHSRQGLRLLRNPLLNISSIRVRNFAIEWRETARLTGKIGSAQNWEVDSTSGFESNGVLDLVLRVGQKVICPNANVAGSSPDGTDSLTVYQSFVFEFLGRHWRFGKSMCYFRSKVTPKLC